MPRTTFPSTRHVLPFLGLLACSDQLGDSVAPPSPDFKPGPAGPSYTIITPPVAPGWTAFSPADINTSHRVIGVMNPEGSSSQTTRRAATWVVGGTAVPEALPLFPGRSRSGAGGISESGIIAGSIFPTAVLWLPTTAGWEIRQLAEYGNVSDVRDDGSAVGTVRDPVQPDQSPPVAVMWDASGTPDTLPLPSSGRWNGGEAIAINRDGDIAGSLEEWTFGSSVAWSAIWIREGEGWTPIALQGSWARGLSNRTADGRIYVTASGTRTAFRHIFSRRASGVWMSDSVFVDGTADDMNATGDFVGSVRKGTWNTIWQPFLYPAVGSLYKLPMPRNATGGANGISNDGWVTGAIDGVGILWKP